MSTFDKLDNVNQGVTAAKRLGIQLGHFDNRAFTNKKQAQILAFLYKFFQFQSER